jgi:glutamine synthetase
LLVPSSISLLSSLEIVTKVEIESRFHIVMEKYAKDLLIEANTLKNMIFQTILPDSYGYRKALADSLASMKACGIDISKSPEKSTFDELTAHTTTLKSSAEKLVQAIERINSLEGEAQAVAANEELIPLFDEVRGAADAVEAKTGDKFWTYPKYNELLF